MSPEMLWSNVLAYSAQVLALGAAGALLPVVFRLRQPRTQLLYCQVLLATCLVLPALQPWRSQVIVVSQSATPAPAVQTSRAGPPAPARPNIRLDEIALLVLAAGASLRALWLLVGLWRLRRCRIDATPLYTFPPALEAARTRTGADATICISEAVKNPVTFGNLDPIILLPPALLEQPADEQFAIACHELLHVRRRDWLYTICEEFAGALLWFHPAVWWLLSQIRLSREQVVDREVVALTESCDRYVHALLAMAGARPRLDLAPAPLFLRKRHLAQRIRSLLKEVSVSKRRLVSSYLSIGVVLMLTTWFVATWFPLKGSPHVQVAREVPPDRKGVSVDPGGRILHRSAVYYPSEARSKGIEGTVTMELTLNSDGAVSDARVLSGPDELRKAVLGSVLQWHYVKDESLPRSVLVTIEFRLPDTPSAPAAPVTPRVPPQTATTQPTRILERINVSNLPEPLQGMMRARLAPFEGQPFSNELMQRIREAAGEIDRHVRFTWRMNPETRNASLTLGLSDLPTPRVQPPDFPPSGEPRIRVGGNVQARKLVEQQAPEYPPLARRARIQGTVRFKVLINKEGRVAEIQLVSGHPLLVPAAVAAVKRWTYQPTLLNGRPVEVVTQVDVPFRLTTQPSPGANTP
jgi:TonB family protein